MRSSAHVATTTNSQPYPPTPFHERYDILTHLRHRHWCPSRCYQYNFQGHRHTFPFTYSTKTETRHAYECPCVKILRFRAVVLLAQIGISATIDEGSNAGVRWRYAYIHPPISLSLILSLSPSLPLCLSYSLLVHPSITSSFSSCLRGAPTEAPSRGCVVTAGSSRRRSNPQLGGRREYQGSLGCAGWHRWRLGEIPNLPR